MSRTVKGFAAFVIGTIATIAAAQDTGASDQQMIDSFNSAKPSVAGVSPQTKGEFVHCAAIYLNMNTLVSDPAAAEYFGSKTPDFSKKNVRWLLVHWLSAASSAYSQPGGTDQSYSDDLNEAFKEVAHYDPLKMMRGLGSCYVPEAEREPYDESMFKSK